MNLESVLEMDVSTFSLHCLFHFFAGVVAPCGRMFAPKVNLGFVLNSATFMVFQFVLVI